MSFQTPQLIVYETDLSDDWQATSTAAKTSLMNYFGFGAQQVLLKHRPHHPVLCTAMLKQLFPQLEELFGCAFTVDHDVENLTFSVDAVGVPHTRDEAVLRKLDIMATCDIISCVNPDASFKPLVEKSTRSRSRSPTVNQKKPPRPMNCWMLFRDNKHKQLKQENPELTVQEISTICSNAWKTLPAAEKQLWKDKADKAKAAHQLLYPGYKYHPRKPGEKKKRQSRKSMEAAAAAAAAATASTTSASQSPVTPSTSSSIPEIFDFNSFEDTNLLTSDGNLISDANLMGTSMMSDTMLMTDAMGVPQVSSFDMTGLTSNTFSSASMGFDMNSVPASMFLPTDANASFDKNSFSSNDLLPCNNVGMMQQAPMSTAVTFSPPNAPATEAPTQRKALNAFVGYRCYYIYAPQFKPWPMKKLSGVLATMWDVEPNKAIWALLAKAWSLIRDQIGKERAPLDVFFKIMCPAMSLPSADTYLELYGWALKVKPDGEPYVSRDFIPGALPEVPSNPTMSIGDIIRYCHGFGYALEFEVDERMTPTTFHIQLGPRQRTSADIIDEMERKRVAQRNKRHAQREKARKTGVPNKVKQQQDKLRSESNRQARLEAEFGEFFHGVGNIDDSLAFRAGADEDATLPEFFSGYF